MAATSHTDLWAGEGLSLRGGYVFKQYMKRALVSLHIMDNFQEEDQRKMIENNVMVMVDSHFHQFEAFNSFLMELYDNKSPQTTVSDLFPEIIEWFEKHNH